MTSIDVRHLSDEQQALTLDACNRVSNSAGTSNYFKELEKYADVLDQVGLHAESRDKFQQIINETDHKITIARCHRKIIASHNAQRNFPAASRSFDEALQAIKHIPISTQEAIDEFFRIHIEGGFVNYFLYDYDKVEDSVRELRRLQDSMKDVNLKIGFMHVVGLSSLIRYRWYKMPEEAFTHAEYFLQFARSCSDPVRLGFATCHAGFIYLWNEEITISRQYFMEAVGFLREKHYGPLLMAYNYLAVGYRMQNNISMTEQWANLTLEKATQTGNLSYVPYAKAHLAWIHAKRNNWLYAEDYARQAKDHWNAEPLIFSYAFVLIDCMVRKNNTEEGGKYAYMLIHPKVKKLPESVTKPLQAAVSSWIRADKPATITNLTNAILASKISGYY
ncbi:hypothetical protein ACX0G7_25710 [Flavitalea antarctica]